MRQRLCLVAMALLAAGCARWRVADEKPVLRAYIVHHGEPTFRKLIAQFERAHGIRVEPRIACRGGLFMVVSNDKEADLCITSGQENIEAFGKAGLCKSPPVRLGEITPVIHVLKGNPKGIRSLADLARPGVRVTLCAGCVGRVADRILENAKLAEKVRPNVVERIRGDLPTALSVDGVKSDATIVWSWTTLEAGLGRYEMVPIPDEANVIDPLGGVVLETGRNKEGARKFLDFLQSDGAKKLLAEAGLARKK